MRGCINIAWGPSGGFYIHNGWSKRICLWWVALTYYPVEPEIIMRNMVRVDRANQRMFDKLEEIEEDSRDSAEACRKHGDGDFKKTADEFEKQADEIAEIIDPLRDDFPRFKIDRPSCHEQPPS